MAKRTYTYDGSEWVGLASPAVSLDNYPNMTTTSISGFRNALINGGMDVWQRGTSGIVPTSTQPYSADRWESYRAGYAAGMSVYRPAGPTGITYAARVQRDVGNTSTASMAFGQAIESVNSTRFDGKNVTLSFWARAGANFSSASSVLTAQVNYGTGNDQNYRAGFTGGTIVVSSGVTLTTSWQRFTIAGNVNVVATQVGVQFSYTPVGTAGAADHFEITGVQLEEGLIATPFEQRPFGLELALCQRYFQRHVDPAGIGVNNGTAATRVLIPLSQRMRVVPTTVISGTFNFWNGGGTNTATVLATAYNSISQGQLDFTTGVGVAGQANALYTTGGSQYADFSAEL